MGKLNKENESMTNNKVSMKMTLERKFFIILILL